MNPCVLSEGRVIRDVRISFFLRSSGFDSIEAFYFAEDLSHPSGA